MTHKKVYLPETQTSITTLSVKRYKICFKFMVQDKDYNFDNKTLTAKTFGIIFDKLRLICSMSKIEFLQLPKENGIEFLEKSDFDINFGSEIDKVERQPFDTKFGVVRFGQKGRLVFKECNIKGEDDILHLFGIDPNHRLY